MCSLVLTLSQPWKRERLRLENRQKIWYNLIFHYTRKFSTIGYCITLAKVRYILLFDNAGVWDWLGIKHRENLRFARTKIWGIVRNLFRAVGTNLHKLGIIKTEQVHSIAILHTGYWLLCFMKDVFYLTVDELFAYVEGRSVTNDLAALADLRKKEWSGYKKV